MQSIQKQREGFISDRKQSEEDITWEQKHWDKVEIFIKFTGYWC